MHGLSGRGRLRGMPGSALPTAARAHNTETGRKFQPGYCPRRAAGRPRFKGYAPARERLSGQAVGASSWAPHEPKKKELREARDAKNSAGHIACVQKDLRDLQLELVQLRLRWHN